MEASYKNGQRVKIRVSDQYGIIKYPNIKKHEKKTGKIIGYKKISEISGIKGIKQMAPPGAVCVYKVQLDDGTILDNLEEGAVEAAD